MKHLNHLKRDPKLAHIITTYGEVPELTTTKDLFVDILGSIVSQQLSTKAADTIWKRFEVLFDSKQITPEKLLQMDTEKIRGVGVSYSKIKYMKGLAEMILQNELNLDTITSLSDSEFIKELTRVKGIGPWTAEMILMFSLGREDVFSLGDLGLRNAISKIYEVDRDNLDEISVISDKWSPYRTYAARYLWKSLDNSPLTASKTSLGKSPRTKKKV